MKKSHDTGPMADLRRAAREAAKRLQERADNQVKWKPNEKRSKNRTANRNLPVRVGVANSDRSVDKRMLDIRAQAGA